jgi:hypothetical protein
MKLALLDNLARIDYLNTLMQFGCFARFTNYTLEYGKKN